MILVLGKVQGKLVLALERSSRWLPELDSSRLQVHGTVASKTKAYYRQIKLKKLKLKKKNPTPDKVNINGSEQKSELE